MDLNRSISVVGHMDLNRKWFCRKDVRSYHMGFSCHRAIEPVADVFLSWGKCDRVTLAVPGVGRTCLSQQYSCHRRCGSRSP